MFNSRAASSRQPQSPTHRHALIQNVAVPVIVASILCSVSTLVAAQSRTSAAPAQRVKVAKVPDVPTPHLVQTRSKPLTRDRTTLVPFDTSPFPYRGLVPKSRKPFLNVTSEDGRLGRRTPYGRLYWEDKTYSDKRVLLHIPKGFDARRPVLMLIFFHGHRATLERDVLRRQRVARQITRSGVNAVLVAPQFAVNAADSSAGKFWEPGAFGRFMGEAASKLARLHGDRKTIRTFASAPVMFIAYSGGYLPAAWCATKGGLNKRLRGVILLDALYGELGKFASWIENDRSAFFVSAYLGSTRAKNQRLASILDHKEIAIDHRLDKRIARGDVTILSGGDEVSHRSLVTRAWVHNPIEDLLRRLPEYQR